MKLSDENPYDPGTTVISADHDSKPRVTTTMATRVKRFVASSLIVMAFVFNGYCGIKLFLDKQWLAAFVVVCIALMLIPLADHTSSMRQRLAASLVMPFALAGLVLSVGIYFLMFRWPFFESIFNGKDTGPLGLIVFALMGLTVGGIAGWRLINYCWKSKIA